MDIPDILDGQKMNKIPNPTVDVHKVERGKIAREPATDNKTMKQYEGKIKRK